MPERYAPAELLRQPFQRVDVYREAVVRLRLGPVDVASQSRIVDLHDPHRSSSTG